jgi:Mn2+/Fe2+ NRAMP family transporter
VKPRKRSVHQPRDSSRQSRIASAAKLLGPGLTTGASDDDPSGIATYSQAGAEFGYSMLWTMRLSYPLMEVALEQHYLTAIVAILGTTISPYLFF